MVDDWVPEEGEIEWVVKCLRNNRSRGASRMREDHIKRWLVAARKAEKEENTAEGEEKGDDNGDGRPI